MSLFPQLRKDPIVDRRVLIAPERGARPMELSFERSVVPSASCAFCEGHERDTPHEVYALRAPGTLPDSAGWRVRVVPNRFPAVRRDAESGYGVHEVVIECPRHESSLAALSVEHVRDVFLVFRERLRDLTADERIQYVQVFKNHGPAAGASVEHVHSQILGVSRVPRTVSDELQSGNEHYRTVGRCIFCDLHQRETASSERLVLFGENCVAFTAYAGRFPFETWVMPRRHVSHFEHASDAEIAEAADSIRTILRRLEHIVDRPSYNLFLHTAPLHDGPRPDYHWHWEIVPRLTGIAGFELACGWFLNPMPPETAAEQLRRD